MSPRWYDFGVELRGEQKFITDVEPERALVCLQHCKWSAGCKKARAGYEV